MPPAIQRRMQLSAVGLGCVTGSAAVTRAPRVAIPAAVMPRRKSRSGARRITPGKTRPLKSPSLSRRSILCLALGPPFEHLFLETRSHVCPDHSLHLVAAFLPIVHVLIHGFAVVEVIADER